MHRNVSNVRWSAAVGGAVLVLLAACGSDSTAPPPPPAVASVAVAPPASSLTVGDTMRLAATVKDASGNVLTDRVVTWASSNPAVATVSGTGLVTGVRADAQQVMITATSETVSGSAGVTVTAPLPTVTLATIEAAAYHTCGRTAAGAAYCWGDNGAAQLGIGALSPPNATTLQPVSGGLTFASVSVGGVHACGLTAGGAAYCWGADVYGGLGGGAPGPETCSFGFPCSSAPLAVAGGRTFSSLSAGWGPTCAVTANGSAYCWGDNLDGALGVGADTGSVQSCSVGPCSYTPLAVAGGLAFTMLGAGNFHACGLTSNGAAYCWGDNAAGELGIGVNAAPDTCASGHGPCSRTPVAVAGGLTFTTLNVGTQHTCGRATDGTWYCWGLNNYGQLGTGATGPESCVGGPGVPCSSTPVAVSAGINLTAVLTGRRHSCGVTSAGAAYCWGENVYGQLGDGTTTNSLTPVAVAGGLTFATLSPFLSHTCGLTTGGVGYCWGSNNRGELGDRTTTTSTVPVRVAGQPAAAAAAARPDAAEQQSHVGRPTARKSPSWAAPSM
jgi:alpha-tubulin suppressor-like RCC1 family protein